MTLAIFLPGKDVFDNPFDQEDYQEAYFELWKHLEKKGEKAYMVRGFQTYLGNNTFSGGWLYEKGEFKRTDEPFTVDLIYNKGGHNEWDKNANVLNHPELDAICRDKWTTYRNFPELCVTTVLVESISDLPNALEKISSDKVVMKPLAMYGGVGVVIVPKKEAASRAKDFPLLVQEFIDSSKGIPGLTDTYHDFRTVVANEDILFTMIRTPPKGKLISNTMQGGTVIMVPLEKRPKEVMEIARSIDKKFKKYGKRMYAIDCMRNSNGEWKLVELNPEPGLMSFFELKEFAPKYFDDLSSYLMKP